MNEILLPIGRLTMEEMFNITEEDIPKIKSKFGSVMVLIFLWRNYDRRFPLV